MTMVETVSLVVLIGFVSGLLLGTVTTVIRIVRYHRYGIPRPKLIWRDLAYVGLMALVFVMISINRLAFGGTLSDDAWWVALTGLIANAAVWIYAWYEVRVIGR